jgi:hypothetical protein
MYFKILKTCDFTFYAVHLETLNNIDKKNILK